MQHGKHLHWCLDVWENEPKINQTILQQALMATPHIAGYSVQGKIRGIHMLYQAMVDKKIIPESIAKPISIPSQKLLFSNKQYLWHEIVLGVFNPLLMTDMLRTALLSSSHPGKAFDELRNQFHDRHEFAFTQIEADLGSEDQMLLKQLGFNLSIR